MFQRKLEDVIMGICLALLVLIIGIAMTVKGGDLFIDAAIWMAKIY